MGVPAQEDDYIAEITERIFLEPIRFALQPEVRDLYMPVAGVAHNIAIVSIDKQYDGQPHKVASALWGAGQMMFNKALVVAPAECNIRNTSELSRLMSNLKPCEDIIFSNGILDVLDHATATCGVGGKIAFDITQRHEERGATMPSDLQYMQGVEIDSSAVGEWSVLIVRALPDMDIEEFITKNNFEGVNFIALFDSTTAHLSHEELLWLAGGNVEVGRDCHLINNVLVVDARSKRPNMGRNPKRFPNVVTSSEQTIALVDRRWKEYGLGEFVESPSLRYRRLLLSEGAEW